MAEHSPTPWRLDGRTIRDAEGDVVVSTFSPANMETRRLIVEAVNDRVNLLNSLSEEQEHIYLLEEERDRLRDLVRRLADSLGVAVDALWQANIDGRLATTQPESRSRHLHGVDIDALLREAREAIKEGEP